MPLIIALIGALVRAVGPIASQVMLALGFSFLSFTGIDFATDQFKQTALSALGANGTLFLQLAGVFNIGTAINMIASAYVGRQVLQGIVGGKLTKMVTKS